jgi:protein-disulfide isomerase
VLTAFRLPLLSLATASLLTFGCHAQQPAPQTVELGKPLPSAVAFRIEALLRRTPDLPPASTINISAPVASKTAGFDQVNVSFTNEGQTSHTIKFLLSADGKTFEQVQTFDLSANPKSEISAAGRPSRGGPETAPVTIVGFDDLECPFCAKLHETIFPAIQNRYGDKVHIVYRDFPLTEIHPWAEHAAVDVECLATQSPAAYWYAVDKMHAQYGTIGDDPSDPKAQKTLDRAVQQLDAMTRTEGQNEHLDMTALNACLAKQDAKAVEASRALAQSLGLQSAPTLFINGDKVDGAVPIEFIFGAIDRALLAEGVAPPPPYVTPVIQPAAAPKGE